MFPWRELFFLLTVVKSSDTTDFEFELSKVCFSARILIVVFFEAFSCIKFWFWTVVEGQKYFFALHEFYLILKTIFWQK